VLEVERDTARAELARLTAPAEGELVAIARAAYDATDEAGIPWIDRIASRVAARVRQERCLVAQAVGMGATVTVERTSARVPGTTGMWDVRVSRRPDAPGEHYAYGVPAAEVPATLARLLGEVARG
jgi:hypothetical protein